MYLIAVHKDTNLTRGLFSPVRRSETTKHKMSKLVVNYFFSKLIYLTSFVHHEVSGTKLMAVEVLDGDEVI